MQKLEQIYEGKAKKVFRTDDPELFIVSYKDDATAFNGLKKGTITGKGAINNRMTNNLMRRLEEKGVPTHYVEELSDRETAVKKVSIVPLEVIVATSPPAPSPSGTAWRRASCSTSPPSSSPIRTTTWATPCSTPPTPWPSSWPPRRRSPSSASTP